MNHNFRSTVLFLSLLLITFLVGCDYIPFTDSGPDDCDSASALFVDDFSGEQNCGWVEYNQGGAVSTIEDGVLKLSTSSPGEIWWTNPGRSYDDVVIDVEAKQVEGPDDNAYGVICRYQNENNFYVFLISGDGYYAIGKYQGGDDRVIYLTENEQFQESDRINQSLSTNQIQAACVGNQLSLMVNGEPLVTVVDTSLRSGDIGLAASALQQGTVTIEFDDIRVTAP